ncbi:hypothetical protein [Pseudoruegeria sp. HB172150]|uniref:hypothetical protein n=1 Tax=Pseudoruegeria sp. HB172150 TaxID=2721164 RepID=UPI00155704C8|nr:hypothetical protein [Pseudoruegeria sp. HB172150]
MITQGDSQGRVVVENGEVTVLDLPNGPTTCRAIASIISPGTERRSLETVRDTGPHAPGYMTLVRCPDGRVSLDPVPHGATFLTNRPRRLSVPEGVRLPQIAAARFQLMAAVTLQQVGFDAGREAGDGHATVLGSGPVAVGCVFELMRRGLRRVTVVTARADSVLCDLGAVELVAPGDITPAPCVIDCTGAPDRAMEATAKGGWLGLLGTPANDYCVSALELHRRGLRVFGLHELGPAPSDYRAMFDTVLAWHLVQGWHDLLEAWCCVLPGKEAPTHYRAILARENLPPFLCLEWNEA